MSKKDQSQKLSWWKDREEPANKSQDQLPDSDWQCLCELELRVFDHAEQTVHVWLTECLKPLDLQEDFMDKVLRSAQGAVARSVRVEPELKPESIHILLFVPPEHGLKNESWGFFRVEKIRDEAQSAVAHGQTMAFYLYLE